MQIYIFSLCMQQNEWQNNYVHFHLHSEADTSPGPLNSYLGNPNVLYFPTEQF